MREGTRTFHYAIEKIKKEGGNEIFCYTIPPGFESHAELLAYWHIGGNWGMKRRLLIARIVDTGCYIYHGRQFFDYKCY